MTPTRPILCITALAAICFGLWLTTAAESDAADADDARANANLLHLGEASDASNGAPPVLLRGSAIPPKPARQATVARTDRMQIAAGRRLWSIDPATGDMRVCWVRRTTTVGLRVLRCLGGSTTGYHRGFGPAFNP